MRLRSDGPVFVSQLTSIYLDMYLVAVKSLAYWVPPSKVIVVLDGAFSSKDLDTLARHVPGVECRPVDSVDTGACPRGGTWERLITCIMESQSRFVLQVDSDTVTVRRPDAVLRAIASNQSYTMSGYVEPVDRDLAVKRLTLPEAAEVRDDHQLGPNGQVHIQLVAERQMCKVAELQGAFYLRGCSGFAGFGAGAITKADAERYSQVMQREIGSRWNEWGTEQVASNFLVANSGNGIALPWPEFVGVMNGLDEELTQMVHFTGPLRFRGGYYQRAVATATLE